MARKAQVQAEQSSNSAMAGYEAELCRLADPLSGSIDAAEYKHVVLGLIFLKYISYGFDAKHAELIAQTAEGADLEDPEEYRATGIVWVPKKGRWIHFKAKRAAVLYR